MRIKTIQDLLPFVEKPSRYLGTEINSIKKDYSHVKLSIALAFPDLYDIGTSHFGLQILYHILNSYQEIAAERVFAPGQDMEAHLRKYAIQLSTLETNRPLSRFDIIGFSLLYELNFTNILTILDLAGIPFLASQRDGSHPLIIAGGPCACNPEPLADIFDAMVIGDGETVITEICNRWLEWKESNNNDRQQLLKDLSGIKGVYVPCFFKPSYDVSGFQNLIPLLPGYEKIERAVVSNLELNHFPETPVIPFGRPVHDRLRLELARGCSRGCRFCQAGIIYRPVRERRMEDILALAKKSLLATGYEDLSLLSLSTGDYGCLPSLMEVLMEKYESQHVAISLPSLRADTLTKKLMGLVKRVRKTGFTIAPEAASQRLRNVINKNITDDEIFSTVLNAFNLGWTVIKLYFMIGLPSEKQDDIEAIIALVKDLSKTEKKGKRKKNINVSVSTFIPKPHTPFQWEPQVSLAESTDKILFLKDRLKGPGINFKWQNPKASFLEGIWARGDRRLCNLLVSAYTKGCRFDGWSDMFKFDLWEEALNETGVDAEFFTTRERANTEVLPWDHIETGVLKKHLIQELERSRSAEAAPGCRVNDCGNCGVCDFKTIAPRIYDINSTRHNVLEKPEENKEIASKKYIFVFSKTGSAKYFGHLELVSIFLRAFRRIGIKMKHSMGFHPKPKISFQRPLPVGMESLEESFYLTVLGETDTDGIISKLNQQLPEGLSVLTCRPAGKKKPAKEVETEAFLLTVGENSFSDEKLNNFLESKDVSITLVNKKGRKKIVNLKKAVLEIEKLSQNRLKMILRQEQGKSVQPLVVVKEIFSFQKERLKMIGILKLPTDKYNGIM